MVRMKFGNRKVKTPDGTFDSKKEYERWCGLKLCVLGGAISDLKRQVPFELIPTQKDANGKVVERAVKYVADFVYTENGQTVVEDTKGMKTPEYIIKRKLMRWVHGIEIREV